MTLPTAKEMRKEFTSQEWDGGERIDIEGAVEEYARRVAKELRGILNTCSDSVPAKIKQLIEQLDGEKIK